MDKTVRETRSPCPECGRELPARIVERGGDLFMLKNCPDHGTFDLFFWRDAAFYRKVAGLARPLPRRSDAARVNGDFSDLRGICLDFTQRCNLFCANCFANANVDMPPDMPLDWYKQKLSSISGRKPVIFVQGGEPTLRMEIFDFIEFLIREGFVVKLVTNGIKLAEPGFIEKLKATGLEWVFLQFDGFSGDTSVQFRGRDLISLKMEVLQKLSDNGFKILLAVMLEKGVNDGEVGDILRLALRTPGVCQIGLLPGSRIGRNRITGALETGSTAVDVMDWLDRDTGGAVTRGDFLAFHKIAARLYRVTRNPDYRPRTCFFFMMLYHEADRVIPVNRLMNPLTALRHPRAALAARYALRSLRRLDNMPAHPNLLFITIEKFRGADTIDLDDAALCVKAHLGPGGDYHPECIYNATKRPQDIGKD